MVPGSGRCDRLAGMPPTTIQVFGLEKDRATRAAERFFKERRVPISFVDFRKRPIAPAELRRFVERRAARRSSVDRRNVEGVP